MPITSSFRMVAAALAGALIVSLPVEAATPASVEAVWVARQVTFIYQGFTTRYSCDGLRDKIHAMLTHLGARDLKVRAIGCARVVGVEDFPGVQVKMEVLLPATSEHGKTGPIVAAHWQNVVLMPRNSSIDEQGECELIEQFKETFLPLFATRHISYSSTCIPHQITLGTHLSAEVLMPSKSAPGH